MQLNQGIVTHNVASLRASPDGDSEQVSQVILGEAVTILEERDLWARVRAPDAYEGWVRRRHVRPSPVQFCEGPGWPFDEAPEQVHRVISGIADLLQTSREPSSLITKLVFGTWVRCIESGPEEEGSIRVTVPFGPAESGLISGYVKRRDLQTPDMWQADLMGFDGVRACGLAQKFVGTPYLWGGSTAFGFDCSGLVQRVFGIMGVTLPRDAHLQAASPRCVRLPEGEITRAGDLIFFAGADDPRKRGITHVGLAVDATHYIHAVGDAGVILTAFDDPYYSARYTQVSASRLLFGDRNFV